MWGYGVFSLNAQRRNVVAHRVAWMLAGNGEVPKDRILMHTCDNPACVNVKHLVLGTQAENIADKTRKNRQARGEGHGMAKLTEQAVREIRDMLGKQRDIAKQYGVTQALVQLIKAHKTWTHI